MIKGIRGCDDNETAITVEQVDGNSFDVAEQLSEREASRIYEQIKREMLDERSVIEFELPNGRKVLSVKANIIDIYVHES